MYLNFFNTTKLTVGKSAILLIDTSNERFFQIPIIFLNAIQLFPRKSLDTIYNIYEKESINQLISFLVKENLAVLLKYRISYSQNNEYNSFGVPKISNAIIEFNNFDLLPYYESIIQQFIILKCKYLAIFIDVNFDKVKEVFDNDYFSSFIYINGKKNIDTYLDNTSLNQNNTYVIYNCDNYRTKNTTQNLKFTSKNLSLNTNICGIVDKELFVCNFQHIEESLAHNTCLNRKIAIDAEGNIKNCPSMKESFGNIRDTTLEEAINKSGFKKYWNIKKDEITKCKDCEFRHVCTDCRAYIDSPEDIYSAPLKCGYNPYTCEWEEWSTNPLKEQAIEYYGMKNLVNNK